MQGLNSANEMFKAVQTLIRVFCTLTRHGFFDFSVSGEKKQGRTIVRISAGKTYKFNIRDNEVNTYNTDSWDGSRSEND